MKSVSFKIFKQCKQKFQKGSSLTEVMIAFFLIVLAIIIITPMFAIGIKSTKIPKERTLSTNLARELISFIEGRGFNYYYPFINENTALSNPIIYTGDINNQSLYIYPKLGEISNKPCNNAPDCKPLQIIKEFTFNKGNDIASPADDYISVVVRIIWPGRNDGGIILTTRLNRSTY